MLFDANRSAHCVVIKKTYLTATSPVNYILAHFLIIISFISPHLNLISTLSDAKKHKRKERRESEKFP